MHANAVRLNLRRYPAHLLYYYCDTALQLFSNTVLRQFNATDPGAAVLQRLANNSGDTPPTALLAKSPLFLLDDAPPQGKQQQHCDYTLMTT
jgi:hypothetical protein